MLQYDRIDISGGIDVDKTKEIKRMYALSLSVFFR